MPLQEERTGWGVWFFLFLFHTPIYTNGCGDSIPKTMCRKKRHIYIVMFFRMKILICSKPAVIDKFNLLADREIFRKCFDDFDYQSVAKYTEEDVQRIIDTEGMIKSERKVRAVIHNAQCFLKIQKEFGTFSDYLWGFTEGKVILYMGHQKGSLPAKNGLSDEISRDLKKRGFKYLGSVTVYSHLQACGMINDHTEECFRYKEVMEGKQAVRKRRNKEG